MCVCVCVRKYTVRDNTNVQKKYFDIKTITKVEATNRFFNYNFFLLKRPSLYTNPTTGRKGGKRPPLLFR